MYSVKNFGLLGGPTLLQVKLGADASAAAGPKGRDAAAATDVTLRAEILTYSRSRGLFAGISLEGSTLRPDKNGNKDLYEKDVPAKDIVLKGAVPAPPSAQELLSTLNSKTPKAKAATEARPIRGLI
jgi:lipid-binding SYLF domain-containing protein